MSQFVEIMREKVLWIIVTLSLGAGLIGAYGRERHEGRSPDFQWWVTRFYIMPFLAIVTSFAISQFGLNSQQSALVAALLAMLGYEAVRLITDSARSRGQKMLHALDGQMKQQIEDPEVSGQPHLQTAKTYYSEIDTDPLGRVVAHLQEVDPGNSETGAALRNAYPVVDKSPDDMNALLRRMD